MMINTHQMLAGGLMLLTASCPTLPGVPEVPDTPQPKLPCTAEVVLLPNIDAPTDCDLIPPMILAAVLDDDPSGAAAEDCHDSGGRVMHDPPTDRFFCIDMDY